MKKLMFTDKLYKSLKKEALECMCDHCKEILATLDELDRLNYQLTVCRNTIRKTIPPIA